MKTKITSILAAIALAGCSTTMPTTPSKAESNQLQPAQLADIAGPDLTSAASDLKLAGFIVEDFGSEASFNSASTMVATLGAEWRSFNTWTFALLEPDNQSKAVERIRTNNDKRRESVRKSNFAHAERYKDTTELALKHGFPNCFDDSGELYSVDDFISRYAGKHGVYSAGTFDNKIELYNSCIVQRGNECIENGQELSLEQFLVNYNASASDETKDLVFNQYYEYCAAPTPVSSVQYTLSAHDNDVIGSLIAAAAPRVGWGLAAKMAQSVVDRQSSSTSMNTIVASFYRYQRTGHFNSFDIRPFAIGRSAVISVMHVGGMCAAFASGEGSKTDIEIDELAVALGAEPRPTDGGYHCLHWSEGNWKRVADYIVGEGEALRGFMSVYSPVFNDYQVPYWSYPGPYQHDSILQTQIQMNGSGMRAHKSKVHELETCSSYAASHSGLGSWSYPACDYLEKASITMKAKEKLMQAAGRLDAYICSRAEAVNGLGKPDLSRCPTVFSREQIEAGAHKH